MDVQVCYEPEQAELTPMCCLCKQAVHQVSQVALSVSQEQVRQHEGGFQKLTMTDACGLRPDCWLHVQDEPTLKILEAASVHTGWIEGSSKGFDMQNAECNTSSQPGHCDRLPQATITAGTVSCI